MKKFITFAIVLGPILFCNAQAPERAKASMCAPNIMSYHFGVENLTIPDRVSALESLKIKGILPIVNKDNITDLDNYYNTNEVKNGKFHIYVIYYSLGVAGNATAIENHYKTIEDIYKKIQFKETVLQIIFAGTSTKENITKIISKCADIAKTYGKDVIIYPHYTYTVATSEIALTYIKAINKPNIFLAMHLCHELSAGHGNRIEEVIKNVAPYIKSASISGATLSEQSDSSLPEWKWGIKPLYMGTYDLSLFYNALHKVKYDGPLAIHTYAIESNFGLNFKQHLPKSREKIDELANIACKNLSDGQNEYYTNIKYSVYPNPSKNGFFQLKKSYVWEIFNVQGMKTAYGEGSLVNASKLSKGIYFLKINNNITKILIE